MDMSCTCTSRCNNFGWSPVSFTGRVGTELLGILKFEDKQGNYRTTNGAGDDADENVV